jgi:rhodanese-related sulfurtransferase
MEASVDETEEGLALLECDRSGAAAMIAAGARLIDVRTAYEFDAGRIPGAERIGLEELSERRDELSADVPILFYCRIGNRSLMAAEAFAEAGYEAASLSGGLEAWLKDGGEVEPADGFVSEPGQAAAILEARSRAAST